MKASSTYGIFILICLSLLIGCSGSDITSPDAGRTLIYEPGVPNFDMEAIPTWREDSGGIDLYLGIPNSSLIFLQEGTQFKASYEGTIELFLEGSKISTKEETWKEVVVVENFESTQSYDATTKQYRFSITPGTYIVQVILTDEQSKKTATRRQKIEVPDLSTGELSASRILLEALKDGGDFEPVVYYHVPADLDSARAIIELYNTESLESVEVKMVLNQYPTDLLPAKPPYWFSPQAGSLEYKGVRFDHPNVLQTTSKNLSNLASEIIVEFSLPDLEPGIYGIDISVLNPQNQEVIFEESRELSIKAAGFPKLQTFHQLVESLVYIAYKEEMRDIVETEDINEMQKKFDAFWGERMPSRQLGLNTFKQYYARIEEANQFFTNHKEGWKTDQGLVYIIMGPPIFVENLFETEVWRYSYSSNDPLSVFVFRKVKPNGSKLQNFILQRSPIYQQEWLRRIERWREGRIL